MRTISANFRALTLGFTAALLLSAQPSPPKSG